MNNRIKIRIYCRNTNYFLKDLISKKIELFNITKNKDNLELIINKNDYKTISKIKTIKKLEIIDYYGTNKIEYLLKKNSCFFMCFLFGLLINIFLSSLILEIDVVTPNKTLEKKIRSDLKSLGIKKYNFKVSFKEKNTIKDKLQQTNKDKIEWLEIEEHGTRYIIKVEEKKLNEEEKDCVIGNIVAKKNAIITKITSSSGEIVKKKNDYVEKGDVLISGEIHNKEDVVNRKCTKGEVFGETWYKVTTTISPKTTKNKLTNNKTYGISIKIFNFSKFFNNNFGIAEKKEYNIIDSKIVPIEINLVKYQELKKINTVYTLKNVDKKALDVATKKLEEKLSSNAKILRKKVLKKQAKNSKILVEVFFAVEEEITTYQKIAIEEEANVRTTHRYNSRSS